MNFIFLIKNVISSTRSRPAFQRALFEEVKRGKMVKLVKSGSERGAFETSNHYFASIDCRYY